VGIDQSEEDQTTGNIQLESYYKWLQANGSSHFFSSRLKYECINWFVRNWSQRKFKVRTPRSPE